MWNFHEHERGQVSWSGRRNITRFVELAGQHGLDVAVRIGPYVCGEYQFGGIPFWLRTLDNVSCFRCSDPVWEREMARFVGEVVDVVRPQLKSRGGPVVMLQVENEYNGPDLPYLKWAVEMARNQTTEVPGTVPRPRHVRGGQHGGQRLSRRQRLRDQRPGWRSAQGLLAAVARVASDLHAQSQQPSIWTRTRDGSTSGVSHSVFATCRPGVRHRAVLRLRRLVAQLLHATGGNYGQSGGQVVTAYAPDTAIDYLLLRHEPRFSTTSPLHARQRLSELLRHPVATPKALARTATSPPSSCSRAPTATCARGRARRFSAVGAARAAPAPD